MHFYAYAYAYMLPNLIAKIAKIKHICKNFGRIIIVFCNSIIR